MLETVHGRKRCGLFHAVIDTDAAAGTALFRVFMAFHTFEELFGAVWRYGQENRISLVIRSVPGLDKKTLGTKAIIVLFFIVYIGIAEINCDAEAYGQALYYGGATGTAAAVQKKSRSLLRRLVIFGEGLPGMKTRLDVHQTRASSLA
jgi:hypothetical protein